LISNWQQPVVALDTVASSFRGRSADAIDHEVLQNSKADFERVQGSLVQQNQVIESSAVFHSTHDERELQGVVAGSVIGLILAAATYIFMLERVNTDYPSSMPSLTPSAAPSISSKPTSPTPSPTPAPTPRIPDSIYRAVSFVLFLASTAGLCLFNGVIGL